MTGLYVAQFESTSLAQETRSLAIPETNDGLPGGPLLNRTPNAEDDAVASNSAWQDAQTLHTRIWFYESPYRIDMVSRFKEDTLHLEIKQNVAFGTAGFELKGTADYR